MAQKAKAAYDSLRSQGNIAKSLEAADRAGRNLRVGLSSVDQVARVLGADLSGVIAPITGIADGIGDISGAINELGLGVGIIGGLVAAFAALNSVMQQRNQQIRDQILKNSELAKSIRELGLAETEAQKKLEELADAQAKVQTGWSFDLGDILANWEKFDIQGRTLAIALHAVGIELKDINPAFESSAEKAARLTKELKDQTDAAYKDAYALAAAQRVAESIGDTRKEAIQDYHDLSKGSYDLYQNTWLATHEFKEGVGWVHKLTAEEQQAVDQAKRLREQWQNVVKSIAASVLKPTEVTEAEQKRMQLQAQLAKIQQRLNNDNLGPQQSRILQQQATDIQNALNVMGPYVDQWDEYARRLEAIKAAAQEGVVNPDWAKMIPPDILAQGTQAIYAWADAEEKAFYNGQRLNEINYSGLAD
ncbi:MAG TPA: hypothetical protein VFD70_18615, partial [Anaerolineae bacterium]|nr:hypothetical protein [Anaerolineae bacterium]